MNLRSRVTRRRLAVKAAVAATALVAAPITLAPQASAAVGPSTCPAGYVCLVTSQSFNPPMVLIPDDQEISFPGGLTVYRFTNRTFHAYCVSGQLSFELTVGQDIVRTDKITSVAPGNFCAS